jgi:hypothetical protein
VSSSAKQYAASVTATSLETDYPFQRTHSARAFLRSPLDGGNNLSVAGCTWTADVSGLTYDASNPHPAFDSVGGAKSGAVDAAWFSTPNQAILRISLPPGSVPGRLIAPVGGEVPVAVTVTFKMKGAYGINGNSARLGQIIVFKPAAPKSMVATLCHELGHSFGMTIMPNKNKVPPGMPAAKHVDNGGPYYRNPATGEVGGAAGIRDCHKGSHCADGLDATLVSFAGKAGTCIMFGEGGSDEAKARTSFCATCKKYVKARNLADLATSFETRPDADC